MIIKWKPKKAPMIIGWSTGLNISRKSTFDNTFDNPFWNLRV